MATSNLFPSSPLSSSTSLPSTTKKSPLHFFHKTPSNFPKTPSKPLKSPALSLSNYPPPPKPPSPPSSPATMTPPPRQPHPDTPGFSVYKTKLTKIDNENRVREEELVEGEYLDVGFLQYRVRFEILEKDDDSSIIRSTIEYELVEEYVIYASLVSINSLAIIAEVVGKHLTEEYKAKLKA